MILELNPLFKNEKQNDKKKGEPKFDMKNFSNIHSSKLAISLPVKTL